MCASALVPVASAYNEVTLSHDEKILMQGINEVRLQHGISPLSLDKRLMSIAREKANDLNDNNYLEHKSLKLGTPKEMIKNNGILFYSIGGENIARGEVDVDAIINAWLDSEGHKYNIMEKNYTKTGVGVVRGKNGVIYCAQIFIG